MNIFNGLDEIVKTDYPLADHTWYGIGGNADYFASPRTVEELSKVMKIASENSLPVYIMGHGSNLLISDEGVNGVVIKLESPDFTTITFDGNNATAGGASNLSKLVIECVRHSLGGLEGLTGVPGTVGGAIRMNSGGSFGDIGSVVESVKIMDQQGNVFEKRRPVLAFGYKSVNILEGGIIISATFNLHTADQDRMLRRIKEIWIYKKNNQPSSRRNAGCVFRNPQGQSAGEIIERVGLKGFEMGKAKISEKHANIIVADEGCSSNDVLALVGHICEVVEQKTGIELQTEIDIW
ncbi:MAG: UDP-N-acetylmuramate dehydrogenase [Sedimentisphaeraceae bacterium JB056]